MQFCLIVNANILLQRHHKDQLDTGRAARGEDIRSFCRDGMTDSLSLGRK